MEIKDYVKQFRDLQKSHKKVRVADQKVLEHYMEKMKATHVGILHPYQFCVFEDEMQEIIKTYTYAYSGEEI